MPPPPPALEIVDREDALHNPWCQRLPSKCMCEGVSWIWADTNQASVRTGKWMLFPGTLTVDAAWAEVKRLMIQGKLGISAKVSPVHHVSQGNHLICVYTYDHDDIEDVMRVLCVLRDSRIPSAAECTLYYKTDDATHAGIYSDSLPKRHPKEVVCKYTSEKLPGPSRDFRVTLRLNNIGPNFNRKTVAERKPNMQPKIKFARASELTGESLSGAGASAGGSTGTATLGGDPMADNGDEDEHGDDPVYGNGGGAAASTRGRDASAARGRAGAGRGRGRGRERGALMSGMADIEDVEYEDSYAGSLGNVDEAWDDYDFPLAPTGQAARQSLSHPRHSLEPQRSGTRTSTLTSPPARADASPRPQRSGNWDDFLYSSSDASSEASPDVPKSITAISSSFSLTGGRSSGLPAPRNPAPTHSPRNPAPTPTTSTQRPPLPADDAGAPSPPASPPHRSLASSSQTRATHLPAASSASSSSSISTHQEPPRWLSKAKSLPEKTVTKAQPSAVATHTTSASSKAAPAVILLSDEEDEEVRGDHAAADRDDDILEPQVIALPTASKARTPPTSHATCAPASVPSTSSPVVPRKRSSLSPGPTAALTSDPAVESGPLFLQQSTVAKRPSLKKEASIEIVEPVPRKQARMEAKPESPEVMPREAFAPGPAEHTPAGHKSAQHRSAAAAAAALAAQRRATEQTTKHASL